MYSDNSLLPAEAVRLAALGNLIEGEKRYADLARDIRHFVGRIVGPSLDMLGSSIELLRYEGLAEALDGEDMEDNPLLRPTDQGREAFQELMLATVRAPMNDVSRLVVALKMRFLKTLDADGQAEQIDLLDEACEIEVARLRDLRSSYSEGPLGAWLDFEIKQIEARLDWLEDLREAL